LPVTPVLHIVAATPDHVEGSKITTYQEPAQGEMEGISRNTDMLCIACQGSLSFLGRKSGHVYYVCDGCKTVQMSPIPNPSDIQSAYICSQYGTATYGQGDPDAIRKSSRPYYVSVGDTLTDHHVSGAVIDYGTGWGGLTEYLIQTGFKCKGLELARNQVAECQRRGLPVEQKTLEALIEQGARVQAIVLCGVFEHLANPKTFLRNAYRMIEDGGLLVSLQPTGTFARLLASVWRMGKFEKTLPSMFSVFDPPWHVALYSPRGMKLIAGECGFDLAEIRFAPQGRVKGHYGVAQALVEWTNRVGWFFFKEAWPLMVSHIFVFKKRPSS
jgi:2-polyprenyl-3-methyl-5-hydroxy-6-metoxy-1,4-benzoquinol methylase